MSAMNADFLASSVIAVNPGITSPARIPATEVLKELQASLGVEIGSLETD